MSRDNSDAILVAGTKLANILRQKKAFTNTATFDLKCEVRAAPSSAVVRQASFNGVHIIILQDCGQGLVGEKGATAHAKETGHLRFGEYSTG